MPRLRSAIFALMIAAALPAAHAASAPAPQCPATWPSQPAAWVAHIDEVNRGLGIPSDYAAKHNLVGRLGAGGFLRPGRIAGKVVFLFLVGFEIGFVPATAGETKRRRGHLPVHRVRLAAIRTDVGIGVGQLLQAFELFPARVTAENVDGHIACNT